MPELPEVECVRQGILECAVGLSISEIWSRNLSHLLDPKSLPLRQLKGQTILSVERKGKYLRWILDNYHLYAHLGMSGVWSYQAKREKHTHLEIMLSNGNNLIYTDPRQFGYLCLQSTTQSSSRWDSLGPDAIGPEFSGSYLFAKSRSSKIPVKVWIMDQNKVAGVGNIYASESLFLASIHPTRPASSLTRTQCDNLATSIKKILRASIRNRGTTFSDYRLTNGRGGSFQDFLKVFQKKGKPCPRCGQGIQQITQGGRSSFFCPGCQY
jgi:formamidopyrimidine-DNA glycosylase